MSLAHPRADVRARAGRSRVEAVAGPPAEASRGPALAGAQAAVEAEANRATVHELLIASQLQRQTTEDVLRQLVQLLDGPPARLEALELSQTSPIQRSNPPGGDTSRSVGLLNPSAVVVKFDVFGGGQPHDAAGTVPVPAGGALVLPVVAGDVSVAADPAGLAAGPVGVFLLRFATVQALYLAGV